MCHDVGMSLPTTLIMNPDQTFTADSDGFLPMVEWAAMNGVAERTVKRWLKAEEIPGAEQRGPKRQWFIPLTSMRISHEERERRAAEAEAAEAEAGTDLVTATSTTVAVPEFEVDEEFQDHLWANDLAAYLARMPAYIPVRIGAAMLGLGIGYVKANPGEFGILHRGGPNQTDVMPKLVILQRAGLDR